MPQASGSVLSSGCPVKGTITAAGDTEYSFGPAGGSFAPARGDASDDMGPRWAAQKHDNWSETRAASKSGASLSSGRSGESEERRRAGRRDEKPSMFVDAEEMKRKVREHLMKPVYDVSQYYHPVGVFREVATNALFEKVTLGVIAVNALWIGVETDHNHANTLLHAHPVFQIAEHSFCAFFSFEWFVRFMAFRRKRDGFRDAWFVFDSCLVFMMVAETWVVTSAMLLAGIGGDSAAGNASILRIARLARLTRMARMARLLRAMPELMILIKGIVAATRSVFFTLLLLCLLLYVFAIAFTQLTTETEVGEHYFKKVPTSMYTLLVYGTLLDSISLPLGELGREQYVFGALFLVFVLLAALTLMNMLIGVLTEVVSAVAATERETLMVTFVRNKMQRALQEIDKNGDGHISKLEFVQILTNKQATEALSEVDVDVVGLVDFADFIFAEEEGKSSHHGGYLDFSRFMDVVLQFRGSNVATVKDLVNLRKVVGDGFKQHMKEVLELKNIMLGDLAAGAAKTKSRYAAARPRTTELKDPSGHGGQTPQAKLMKRRRLEDEAPNPGRQGSERPFGPRLFALGCTPPPPPQLGRPLLDPAPPAPFGAEPPLLALPMPGPEELPPLPGFLC